MYIVLISSVLCVYFAVEAMERQAQQLKASCAELQSSLTSECEQTAQLNTLLSAERQTAASAHEQCNVLSDRLVEMQKTLSDTEDRLRAVLYVMFCVPGVCNCIPLILSFSIGRIHLIS